MFNEIDGIIRDFHRDGEVFFYGPADKHICYRISPSGRYPYITVAWFNDGPLQPSLTIVNPGWELVRQPPRKDLDETAEGYETMTVDYAIRAVCAAVFAGRRLYQLRCEFPLNRVNGETVLP